MRNQNREREREVPSECLPKKIVWTVPAKTPRVLVLLSSCDPPAMQTWNYMLHVYRRIRLSRSFHHFKHTMNCCSGLIVSSCLLFVVGCLLCVVIVVSCFLLVLWYVACCLLRNVCCVDVWMCVGVFGLAVAAVVASVVHWCHLI